MIHNPVCALHAAAAPSILSASGTGLTLVASQAPFPVVGQVYELEDV
jgi:hypothetical protein